MKPDEISTIENVTQETNSTDNKSNSLSSDAVIEFLSKNPSFIIDNPSLLSRIELIDSLPESGQPISLIQRQVSILRDEKNVLNDKLNNVIKIANTNEELYKNTRDLIINIMKQPTLTSLITLLNLNISSYFKIENSNIILFDSRLKKLAPEYIQNIQDVSSQITSIVKKKSVVCGVLRDSELDFLLNGCKSIKSAAVLPLYHKDILLGVFAMGSSDPDHFKTGSDTALIDFLHDVICLSIQRYI